VSDLQPRERLFYRDRLRAARYAALADAEGFESICFALEALGLRLRGRQAALGLYRENIAPQAIRALVFEELSGAFPLRFKTFEALFSIVLAARNDAMHTGSYARHATQAAIELCIGLEEALMAGVERTVENLMVSSPVTVESWQPVAHARQLMLMHSFSFLPVLLEGAWCLISELGLAKYLSEGARKTRLCESIADAKSNGMQVREISDAELLRAGMPVAAVLAGAQVQDGPMLWLVVDERQPDHLAGVLSPFELM
jgi:CBS domain-containing protein